jgi:hypothetical protein
MEPVFICCGRASISFEKTSLRHTSFYAYRPLLIRKVSFGTSSIDRLLFIPLISGISFIPLETRLRGNKQR